MEKETTLPDLTVQGYHPKEGESIFHYCPAPAFWAICRSQTIWLSSVYTLNDGEELVWGRRLVDRVFANHSVEFPIDFRRFLSQAIPEPDKHVLPLIASFSKEGDLLSQWRAYAEDARGFVLELDAARIFASMPVNLKNVLYNQAQQEALILNSLHLFHSYWKMGKQAAANAILEVLPYFAIDLIAFKHPSFFEEQEVRMVHLVVRSGNWWADAGGHTEQQEEIEGGKVEKRKRGNLEIPYIALPLPDPSIVKGVIFGPKNTISFEEVEKELTQLGLNNVSLRRSSSPYR